ncbi:LLM class flavin-dependent oxidoreductase [Fuscibacter oryzae]|uniref:Luciferase-like monooxygenase n=1 Tax=Fuscibacter oryzae TaxID=2803939 RepID=A0A8J7MSN8_9RHOB|nr:LLM class flavin-dependent oxidoreductase [Fuscibacter oryzae]MBL4927698.1 LLM class flavin-dependent oxidoreductase [Fuscibacter oryzae]
MQYSLLDLCPVPEGGDAAMALANSVDLARHAEAQGYHRFWLAEHHNMPGIASSATALVIGHVAAGTRSIRVGAGGIMLPNHAPLQVAEAFGTLATLYPDRIDLGLGRAPGTDGVTARALRRHMDQSDRFPEDVMELLHYLDAPRVDAPVRAIPGEGTAVPVWILGSSLYGAQLAAYLGLPYAFASHFAPDHLEEAAAQYRQLFHPSQWLEAPHFMMAVGVCAADTDEEATYLRSSQVLAFARLRMGNPGKLPRPTGDLSEVPAAMLREVDRVLGCSAVGSSETVARRLAELIAHHKPDEVMVTGMIHDHAKRLESHRIAAKVLATL